MSKQNGTDEGTSSRTVIVVGVDFSSLSNEALWTAADLARSNGSELHVVHVLSRPVGDPVLSGPASRDSVFASKINEVRAALHVLVDPMVDGIVRACLHVRMGSADREIVQIASDLGADLVIVGTHGRTGLDRLLLGSTAESVVRRAPCPVYAYRPKTVNAWDQIEPRCPDCVVAQSETGGSKLWCDQHSLHHSRAHTYHEVPQSFGMGAQTFRGPS